MSTFEEQALPHYTYLYKSAVKMCYGNVEEAEDIVQETFTRAYENFGKFDENKSSLITWLYRILRNIRLDQMKWRTRHPAAIPFDTEEADEALSMRTYDTNYWHDEQWVTQTIEQTLSEFSEDEQMTFRRVTDGEKIVDVAKDMGIRRETVTRRVNSIRGRLRFHLRKYLEEVY